jgi:hypothetical protein
VVAELGVGKHCTFFVLFPAHLFLQRRGLPVGKHRREGEGVRKGKGVMKQLLTGVGGALWCSP